MAIALVNLKDALGKKLSTVATEDTPQVNGRHRQRLPRWDQSVFRKGRIPLESQTGQVTFPGSYRRLLLAALIATVLFPILPSSEQWLPLTKLKWYEGFTERC